jgi:hypothetical protein
MSKSIVQTCVLVAITATVVACADESVAPTSLDVGVVETIAHAGIGNCGLDQLSETVGTGAQRLTVGGPPRLQQITVTARMPVQWISWGQLTGSAYRVERYLPQSDLACQLSLGSEFVVGGSEPIGNDTTDYDTPPDGTDLALWLSLPQAVRRLIVDFADGLAGKFELYQVNIPGYPIGQISRSAYKVYIQERLIEMFTESVQRANMDFSVIDPIVAGMRNNRYMNYGEFTRARAFALGCASYTRMVHLFTGPARITPEEGEAATSRIAGAFVGLDLPESFAFLEVKASELVLLGAKAGRAGVSCLTALQDVINVTGESHNQILDRPPGQGDQL